MTLLHGLNSVFDLLWKNIYVGMYEGGVHNLGGILFFFSPRRMQPMYVITMVWLVFEDKLQEFINVALA